MTTKSRLERLQEMAQKNPQDAFAWYGLAMEFKGQEKYADAAETFEQLLKAHPGYTPAYFHYGMSLKALGQNGKAVTVLTRGIQIASEKGDWHARDELQAALQELS